LETAARKAQQRSAPFPGRDCSGGTVEYRLDCLTPEIARIRRRLDGYEGRVIPLRR